MVHSSDLGLFFQDIFLLIFPTIQKPSKTIIFGMPGISSNSKKLPRPPKLFCCPGDPCALGDPHPRRGLRRRRRGAAAERAEPLQHGPPGKAAEFTELEDQLCDDISDYDPLIFIILYYNYNYKHFKTFSSFLISQNFHLLLISHDSEISH